MKEFTIAAPEASLVSSYTTSTTAHIRGPYEVKVVILKGPQYTEASLVTHTHASTCKEAESSTESHNSHFRVMEFVPMSKDSG